MTRQTSAAAQILVSLLWHRASSGFVDPALSSVITARVTASSAITARRRSEEPYFLELQQCRVHCVTAARKRPTAEVNEIIIIPLS